MKSLSPPAGRLGDSARLSCNAVTDNRSKLMLQKKEELLLRSTVIGYMYHVIERVPFVIMPFDLNRILQMSVHSEFQEL